MTKLMQQLQAWADEGLIVFPEGDYKGGLDVPIESLSPYGGKPEGKCTKDAWKLYHDGWVRTFGGYLQLVLDGTIQVWRPVEHYPLKEGDTVLVRINPELKDGNASGYAVCRYETEYPLSGGEYHDLLIERPLIGDDMFDVLCDAKNYEGEEIDPCGFKLELSDITHWQPLPKMEVIHA